jgi:hypothetical protein
MKTPEPVLPAVPTPAQVPVPAPKFNVTSLIASDADLGLTVDERQALESYQTAMLVLGPAAGSVLLCPGNQDNLDEQDRCPYSAKCPLLRMGKAPESKLCPLEMKVTEERFGAWCRELGKEPGQLDESDRSAVSDLVWIDLQEQRCLHIVAKGEEARLTVINPKDVHPETLQPVSWERVIHPNVELLAQLQTQRRIILKDWMLTPEQKWKVARAEGKGSGKDIASQQSAKADKLRRFDGPIIEG